MTPKKQHLILDRPGFADLAAEELRDRWGFVPAMAGAAGVVVDEKHTLPPLADVVFARQYLPRATAIASADLSACVAFALKRIETMAGRANRQTGRWTLHAFAIDDDPALQRALKLEKALLAAVKAKLPRLHARYAAPLDLTKTPPAADDVIVQVYCASPDLVWVSTATVGSGVSPYVAGNQRMRHRAGAPSRSARKLQEAFVELGRAPEPGETAVDLGAAPGGWTFVLASEGADVTAVDHAALSLPADKKLRGAVVHVEDNGLKYMPPVPVDWLCCDMVVAPAEALRVLERWLAKRWMRNFVVNLKLPQAEPWPVVRAALDLLAAHPSYAGRIKHLYHDRREVTLMGVSG